MRYKRIKAEAVTLPCYWKIASLVLLVSALNVGLLISSSKASVERKSKGYIGIIMQSLDEEMARGLGLRVKHGVLVSQVMADGPAEEAGLDEGDVIIEFNGKKVEEPEDLRRMVRNTPVGKKAKIRIIRDNKKKTVTVTIGPRPEEESFSFEFPEDFPALKRGFLSLFNPCRKLGVKVFDMDSDLAGYFDMRKEKGVLVLDVEDDSAAEEAGVKAGDVILEIDGDRVDSVDDLKDILRDMESGEEFDLVVMRHGKHKELTGEIEDDGQHWHFRSYRGSGPESRERVFVYKMDREELREEVEKLKKEMKELKRELRKLERD